MKQSLISVAHKSIVDNRVTLNSIHLVETEEIRTFKVLDGLREMWKKISKSDQEILKGFLLQTLLSKWLLHSQLLVLTFQLFDLSEKCCDQSRLS